MSSRIEDGSALLDDLSKIDHNQALNQITIDDFKRILLPIALAIHSKQDINPGQWVSIAGSVTRGVVVTDNMKNPIFITPPLFQVLTVKINADFQRLHDDIDRAKEIGGSLNDVFNQHIHQQSVRVMPSPDLSMAPLEWAKIFSRFGYKMVRIDGNPALSAPTETTNSMSNGADEEWL